MAARFLLLSTLLPFSVFALIYDVHFYGIENKRTLKALREASELISLQDRPPPSITGLRYRAQADLPNLLRVLRAYAYYDATISFAIDHKPRAAQVNLFIRAGPQYEIGRYEIYRQPCLEKLGELPTCALIEGKDIGLAAGQPALSVDILNGELALLTALSRCGYPLAAIDKRKIEVDMAAKAVNTSVCIEEGPLSKFGPTTLFGLKEVHPRYVERRFAWKEGEIYNSDYVEETQRRILKSDLFSSVLVSHEEKLDSIGELPMKIRLTEAKHRLLSISAFYATVDGPGVSAGWTHRNIRGMGEIFSVYAEGSARYWVGSLSYTKPDFLRIDQTYKTWGAVSRENIYAYLSYNYRAAQRIERKIDEKRTISLGMKLEHIEVEQSASNGSYTLIGIPFFARYDGTDSTLDPTKGYTLVYQGTPYQSLVSGHEHFLKQRVTGTVYLPLVPSKKWVLALRAQFGSIAGARQSNVPLPKLFLGGSLDDLRGYRYKSVSPLKEESPDRNRPYGGRGAIFATAEARFRVSPSIGLVSFADFGTVTSTEYPEVHAVWYKSVGAGLRYFTFFGPLRFDVGFPLDRRHKFDGSGKRGSGYIDPFVNFYASVGQTF